MLGTRYEEYEQLRNDLPFIFNGNIKRNYYNLSKENNWHENLEIQFCVNGCGTLFLDGKKYPLCKDDMAVVNSNAIHYTGTDSELIYDALIIGTDFCDLMGFDINALDFETLIKSTTAIQIFLKLKEVYFNSSAPYRKATLNKLLLELLLELTENHCSKRHSCSEKNRAYERVKLTILYIRKNYQKKLTLEEIAKAVFSDKYSLCKDFKKYTGQTIFENLNNYRCVKALDFLAAGNTVAQVSSLCGFDNFSYFTKTFKKHIGRLPSEYKK